MNELHLFAGAGGGILGGMLLGHTTVCAVELEEYPRRVLLQRQRDGILPHFPIWDDVCTFDGRPWRGTVDVICGGFPCQDISSAGKGAGIAGERSGLWKEYARIIGEVRPKYVFAENSPLLRTRGLAVVLEDLAEMGYDARWGVLGAWHAGAPHKRDRMWVLAWDTNRVNEQEVGGVCRGETTHASGVCGEGSEDLAHANLQHGERRPKPQQPTGASGESRDQLARCGVEVDVAHSEMLYTQGCEVRPREVESGGGCFRNRWWDKDPAEQESSQSFVGRVANGVADRVGRLKAIGNGQVPEVARLAWETLACNPESPSV